MHRRRTKVSAEVHQEIRAGSLKTRSTKGQSNKTANVYKLNLKKCCHLAKQKISNRPPNFSIKKDKFHGKKSYVSSTRLSSTSIITSFGGEREAKPSISYKSAQNQSPQSAALCNSEFQRRQCEGMKIAIGPRLHDQCGSKVTFEKYPDISSEALEGAISSAYKHVYGNAHVMDNERSTSLEAQLRDGRISIQDFVRGLAKSDFYKKNFYDKCTPERTIELDFKHILGRTPHDQCEITKYIEIQASKGHPAVIDSMVDSAEYSETFGRYTVPFMRSWLSQAGSAQSAFNRTAAICLGYAYSDKAIGINSKLSQGLKTGQADSIVFPHASKLNFSGVNLILKKGKPAAWIRKSATVLTIAGAIEVTRIILTIAYSALAS